MYDVSCHNEWSNDAVGGSNKPVRRLSTRRCRFSSAFHSVFSLCVHAADHLRTPAANDSVVLVHKPYRSVTLAWRCVAADQLRTVRRTFCGQLYKYVAAD